MGKVKVNGAVPPMYNGKDTWWNSLRQGIIEAWGVKPNHVIGQEDWRTEHYKEQLRRITKGIIDVECTNKTWDMDYFKETLLFDGKITITDTSKGIIPQACGVFGKNVFHRATNVRVDNPVLEHLERTIGFDCSLIYLMDNTCFANFSNLVDIFACKLSMCDSSIDANLLNSKVAFIINAENKKQADEAKMIYDKIMSGEPAVFYTNETSMGKQMEMFNRDVKGSYIADAIQTEKRAILNEFMTYIGINNMNVEKRERLLFDEINGNNDEIFCNMKQVKENVEKGVEETNKLYPGLNLSIKFPFMEKLDVEATMGEMKKLKTFDPMTERDKLQDNGGDKK